MSAAKRDDWRDTLRTILRALAHRNFRIFFIGQGISLIGTWMQHVALSWLVYRMTNSPLMLGLTGFAGQIPMFFLAPFAGVLIDRTNRHHIMIITQALSMTQALLLFILISTGSIDMGWILGLSIFAGLVNVFDIPARQSLLVQMIDNRDDLQNAIALNSSMFNAARLVGPAIAGVVIVLHSENVCFLLNALSYLAVLVSLFFMKLPHVPLMRHDDFFRGLREGIAYVKNFLPVRYILLLLAIVSVAGMPYNVLMPVFARKVFQGGPDTLGMLVGASGLGALAGALYLAARKTVRGLAANIGKGALVFGMALTLFSMIPLLPFSIFLMMMSGFALMVQMASSNTVLQTLADDEMRGRVMSFYTMSFMGTLPFGSLLGGLIADAIGARWTLMLGGTACMAGGALFLSKLPAIRKQMRPVYIRKGIITEIGPAEPQN